MPAVIHESRWCYAVAAALALSGCCLDCSYRLAKAEYYLKPNSFYSRGTPVHEIEVHADTLDKVGGNTKAPQFEKYVTGILKANNLCPGGWKRHEGTGAAAGYGTRYSVVVFVECI